MDYTKWQQAWTGAEGVRRPCPRTLLTSASRAVPSGRARLAVTGGLLAPPLGAALVLLAPPLARLRPRLPRGARRPLRLRVLDGRPVHRRARPHAWNARQLPRCSGDSSAYRSIALRTIVIAAAVTAADAILAFPLAYFMARVAGRRSRAFVFAARPAAALVELPDPCLLWRLILAHNGAPQLDAAQGRTAAGEHRLLELGDVAHLHVRLAALHDPAGLRCARANPGVATSRRRATSAPAACTTFSVRPAPLALPGVIAGSIFTFSLTLGDYITPLLVGGASVAIHRQRRLRPIDRRRQQLPFAAAFAAVPARRHGRLPPDRAPARRIRGDVRWRRRPTRIALTRLGRRSSSALPLDPARADHRSTRSTPRTSRAGRSRASRRTGSAPAWPTRRCARRCGSRCGPA